MEIDLAKTYERSRVPLYLQVASALRRRIQRGNWKVGDKISTLEELETEFQVARVTLRKAIDILQTDGILDCRQGRGTFVSRGIEDNRWLQLETHWSSLNVIIEGNVPQILSLEEAPPPQIFDGEGVPAPDYQHIRSIQSRDGQPYALVAVHLAKPIYDLAPDAFQTHPALAILSKRSDVKIARAHQTLIIGTADMETASSLEMALNSPTAEARCVVTDDHGIAIYVGEMIYRGDCVRLDISLLPDEDA